MFKHLFLRAPVQSRERIIQDHHRLSMAKHSRQGKARRLTAGETDAAVSDNRIFPVLHLPDLLIKAYSTQPCPDITVISQKNIISDAVAQKFRIMSEISDESAPLLFRTGGEFSAAICQMAFIRIFAEKCLSERRFSARHRTRDSDDLSRFRGEGKILKDRRTARIAECQMICGNDAVFRMTFACFCTEFFSLLCDLILLLSLSSPLHIRMDPLPGHLCLVDRVEEFRRLRGLVGKLRIAREEGRKCCDIPARPAASKDVLRAKIQDHHGSRHRDHLVDRRQGRVPDIGPDCRTLILFQMDLIIFSPLLLTSEHPVCDRVCDPVQCRCIEFSGLFLVSSPRSLDDPFHLLRDNIGKRRKDQ